MAMGKASRGKGDDDRRARIAAQREAERRAQQRRRIYLAGGSILVVAIVVVALVLVKLNSGNGTAAKSSDGPTGSALTTLTNKVTGAPASVTDKVGSGGVPAGVFAAGQTSAQIQNAANNLGSYMITADGPALTSGGKPEVLYIGAEYCPYCAAERWAMVNALSRFGTFTGLTTTHSSSTDAYPNSPTWTFYKSTFTSKYLTFTPVEETANYRQRNSSNLTVPYVTLQTPTAAETALQVKYDPGPSSQPGQSIPFIDLGNKYVEVGNLAPLSPSMLAGKTWAQVATAMQDPASSLGQAIIGNANYLTAATCKLTDNQPASACTASIQSLQTKLAS
jgi:hypothetical protein